jgi:hypothetical protein
VEPNAGSQCIQILFEIEKYMNREQTVVCHSTYHRKEQTLTQYQNNFILSAVEKILVLVTSRPGFICYSFQELVR